jgi:2-polyprenyl-3-methyl-5-hydroxy-6-metoxy-1,4-benzoquinol methylase
MKESDIRPRKLFAEFLRLAAVDAEAYFDWSDAVETECPLCSINGNDSKSEVLFEKFRFEYSACTTCNSWFASRRPSGSQIKSWYADSPAARFWATDFYAKTAESRREHVWRHKALQLRHQLETKLLSDITVVDIGGGYGVFADEFRTLTGSKVLVIEPGPLLAEECRRKGLDVVQAFLEDVSLTNLPRGPKVFTCFELFEHLDDPQHFFQSLRALMSPGDTAFFTTLSSGGLDISLLGAAHAAVSPPHHLLFANPQSIRKFLGTCGFARIKTATPGRLDLDILYQNIDQLGPGFWLNFLEKSDETERLMAQEIVAELGMSSHMSFSFEVLTPAVQKEGVA